MMSGQQHAPTALYPPLRKTWYPFYRRLGGPQGQSGWAENLVPTGIRTRTVQPVVDRYTDWATGAQYGNYLSIKISNFLSPELLLTSWNPFTLSELQWADNCNTKQYTLYFPLLLSSTWTPHICSFYIQNPYYLSLYFVKTVPPRGHLWTSTTEHSQYSREKYKVKVNQSHYRPEVPRGFQEVEVPRLRGDGPGWW